MNVKSFVFIYAKGWRHETGWPASFCAHHRCPDNHQKMLTAMTLIWWDCVDSHSNTGHREILSLLSVTPWPLSGCTGLLTVNAMGSISHLGDFQTPSQAPIWIQCKLGTRKCSGKVKVPSIIVTTLLAMCQLIYKIWLLAPCTKYV